MEKMEVDANRPFRFVDSPVRRPRIWTVDQIALFLGLFDVFLLAAGGVAANYIRFGTFDVSGIRGMMLIFAALLSWMLFRHAKLHDPAVLGSAVSQMRRALKALCMVFLSIFAIAYAIKTSESISRLWVMLWFACASGAMLFSRIFIAHFYRKQQAAGLHVRRVAVCSSVRCAKRIELFLQRWRELAPPSDELAGIYLDDMDDKGGRAAGWKHLVRGSVDGLLREAEAGHLDTTLVIMPSGGCDNLEPIIQKLRTVSMDVDLLAGEVDPIWANRPVGKVAGLPVARIMRRPLDGTQVLLKRGFDLVVATIALLGSSLIMLLIAIAVRLDSPGPVLFRQYRHGFNNRPFQVFKFRTMYHAPERNNDVRQACRDDARVTRIGRLLRRTSLDELPQLINVLVGEMSIVGPRPHACEHNDQFARQIDSYLARHRIKPGITGWAQVNGYRGETDTLAKMRKRVELDLYYADNWSIMLDLKIIVLTLGCLLHPNAY